MSVSLPSITLVLGGQRSGKSSYAEGLICSGQDALYLATAQILDKEMRERVRIHKNRRNKNWMTVEEPFDLASALQMNDKSGRPILIDSLGMWISNLLAYERDLIHTWITTYQLFTVKTICKSKICSQILYVRVVWITSQERKWFSLLNLKW